MKHAWLNMGLCLSLSVMAQGSSAAAATARTGATVAEGANTVGAQKVRFRNGAIDMAGHLYLPPGFDPTQRYAAIVVAHPWGGVKEQTAGLYAQQLALRGFVTLAYDAAHYGDSGGEPRDLEDPAQRVQDIRSAVGYLSNLPQVDARRIGALGVCAGGGYVLHEAQTDPRVKAVAGVVAYDIGGATREGIEGAPVTAADRQALLARVSAQLNKEAAGAPVLSEPLVPSRAEWTDSTPGFLREAYDYYQTPRGAHPHARNRYVVTSPSLHIGYYPLAHMEAVSPRAVLLIAGEKAETLRFSQEAYDRALQPKELLVIPGASHFDLYDKPAYVGPALDKLTAFFQQHLTP